MSGQCRTPVIAVLPTLTRESASGKSRLTSLGSMSGRDRIVTVGCHDIANVDLRVGIGQKSANLV